MKDKRIQIVLADPQGSALMNKVNYGVMFNTSQADGKRSRVQIDTVVEGIGLNRMTGLFDKAIIDTSYMITDEEALDMAKYLLKHEGTLCKRGTHNLL